MSYELLCSWLDLPADRWPPDHYALLGLPAGEPDLHRIEQHIHERMDRVRRYQLLHPEQATEGMNKLAQAFCCLTDPQAKRIYDGALLGTPFQAPVPFATTVMVAELPARLPVQPPPVQPPVPVGLPAALTQTVVETIGATISGETELDWKLAPPPIRDGYPVGLPVGRLEPSPLPNGTPQPVVIAPTIVISEPASKDAAEPARASALLRRGLGTKRALYHRICLTRELLAAWQQVGKYLADPERKLTKRDEALELGRQLTNIRELLAGFPPVLGQAGQPGYLVVAIARQQLIVQTFLTLLPSQREALMRDWQAGLTLLTGHRTFLRQECKVLRRQGVVGQAVRALQVAVDDHPVLLIVLAVVVALNAVWPEFRDTWIYQLIVLAGIIGLDLLMQGVLSPRRWLRRARPSST